MELQNHWGPVDSHKELPEDQLAQLFGMRSSYYTPTQPSAPTVDAKASAQLGVGVNGRKPAGTAGPDVEGGAVARPNATGTDGGAHAGVSAPGVTRIGNPGVTHISKPGVTRIGRSMQPTRPATLATPGSSVAAAATATQQQAASPIASLPSNGANAVLGAGHALAAASGSASAVVQQSRQQASARGSGQVLPWQPNPAPPESTSAAAAASDTAKLGPSNQQPPATRTALATGNATGASGKAHAAQRTQQAARPAHGAGFGAAGPTAGAVRIDSRTQHASDRAHNEAVLAAAGMAGERMLQEQQWTVQVGVIQDSRLYAALLAVPIAKEATTLSRLPPACLVCLGCRVLQSDRRELVSHGLWHSAPVALWWDAWARKLPIGKVGLAACLAHKRLCLRLHRRRREAVVEAKGTRSARAQWPTGWPRSC